MPRYDFQCAKCQSVEKNIVLPITHLDSQIPVCCDSTMGYYITQAPMVVWKDPQIEPFKPTATPNAPLISTTKQRREYMARNHLLDANEVFEPPSHQAQRAAVAKMTETIDAITPTAQQQEQLQVMGLDSPNDI